MRRVRSSIKSRVEIIGDATLYLGDCVDVSRSVGRVDAVITDPPFEEQAHSKQRRTHGGKVNAPLDFPPVTVEQREWLPRWAGKNCHGWILIFCQAEGINLWKDELDRFDCDYKRAMVWIKPGAQPQWSGDRPGAGYENIIAAWCGGGRSKWNGGGRAGLFQYSARSGNSYEHQTQKPDSLMNELVELFTDPGATVFDPFMGSGSTGVACLRLGRKFVGVEISEKYFDVACRRIEKEYRRGSFLGPAPRMSSRQGVLDK